MVSVSDTWFFHPLLWTNLSKPFPGMRNKRTSLDCPAWAGQGWCLEMISWRQPPIRSPVWYSLTAHPNPAFEACLYLWGQCPHNSLLGWGLGCLVLNQRDEKPCGTRALWGVQSGDVHCCLCGGQAGSPGKEPGGLLNCSLEICWGWWWSGSSGVCMGAGL